VVWQFRDRKLHERLKYKTYFNVLRAANEINLYFLVLEWIKAINTNNGGYTKTVLKIREISVTPNIYREIKYIIIIFDLLK